MSRIPAVDPSTAQGEAKTLLDGVNSAFGVTPNLFRVAANSSAALNGLVQLNTALAKGAFRARLREAIGLTVAQANTCDYCLSAHSAIGRGAGMSDADIASAREARASDPKTAAILAFTEKVVRDRAQISDAELTTVKSAGVTNGEIVEIVANIALNVFTNYLNIVADTEIDFPVVSSQAAVR